MPTTRWGLAAATGLAGRIYAIGGFNGEDNVDNVEVYDPSTQRWSSAEPLLSSFSFLAAATGSDGTIYAFGGCGFTAKCVADYVLQAYDPVANRWRRLTDMDSNRAFLAGAARSDGSIYAIGGIGDFQQVLASVEVYDPLSNSCSEVTP